LTYRQQLFVEYYLGEARGNGVAAARLAGYRGDGDALHVTAYRLLRNATIASRIRARVSEVAGNTDDILVQLWALASAPTSHFMIQTREERCDADGNRVREMQARLDYSAKVRALELLMRYHRMLDEKAAVDVPIKALVGVDISKI
jgi:phage terminase small subunit